MDQVASGWLNAPSTFDFWCPVLLFSRQKEEITCVVAGVADQMDTHISWLALEKRKKLSLLYSRNIIFSRPRKQKSPQHVMRDKSIKVAFFLSV